MIIGEKTKFAVEFYALLDTIPPFGRICYWIDNAYPLTVDAAESFDGYHVFLLQDIRKNTWIIAEDFEEQRYCCIDVDIADIQNIFCDLSNKIHHLLEQHPQ